MAAEVIWTQTAMEDVEKIRSQEGSELVRDILSAVHTMSFHIWDGGVVPEYGIHTVREFTISNYLVFYQILIKPERMEILAVRHKSIRG